MKRLILNVAFLLCILGILSVHGDAAGIDVVASGQCGDALSWTLDAEGTLTISGEGEMWNGDMYMEHCLQWSSYQKDVTNVVLHSGVTSIGKQAFYCFENIESVSIPDTVTSVDSGAFKLARKLETIDIPDSVIYIGDSAFYGCDGLTSVKLSSSITHLWEYTFYGCDKLCFIEIPYGVTYIGHSAFSGCEALKEIIIPETVDTICSYAFNACKSLEYISLPSKLCVLERCAFQNCFNLTSVDFPEYLEAIEFKAFSNCQSLVRVAVPNGVEDIYSDAFYACTELKSVILADSVLNIWNNAFRACWQLSSITIPHNVKTISGGAFSECNNLSSIYFLGDAPDFEEVDLYYADERDIFQGTTTIAYYPANNPTWTEEVMQDYGGEITWVAYDPESGEVEAESKVLGEEDYLAFAAIAYKDLTEDRTVEYGLRELGLWEAPMDDNQPDITYGELCRNIADWTVCLFRENTDTGFAAAAFRNDANEVVIAYRGSKPISNFLEIFTSDDPDIINDWKNNDLAMILNNHIRDENQFADALEFYRDVVRETGSSNIVTTGHSLGGLWGDVVSAYSGCKGVTFNAISALDVIYSEFYQDMAPGFTGIDRWNFMDHANQHDVLAGTTEAVTAILAGGTKLKPFISYESDYVWWSLGSHHGLHTYLNEVNGKPTLNARSGEWRPTTGVSNYLSSTLTSVDMGVSGGDHFDKGLSLAVSRTSYGGNGVDTVISSIRGDTLIGGNGSDTLEGGWGSDTYVYYKGNGCDTICDTDGSDKLYLKGFGASDRIEVFEEGDSDFIDVLCNGESIVRISKKNREYSLAALDTFKIYVEKGSGSVQEYDITKAFERYSYGSHLLIRCPVEVQILDANGNVVHTVKDGEISRVHNEYGNFYVFQEDNGGYGKVLDLVEGYTAQVVGLDDGTMNITYYNVKDGELAEPQVMEDIPVCQGYIARVEETENGGFQLIPENSADLLWGDVNGDGRVNFKDAVLMLQYASGRVTEAQMDTAVADVNGDGRINFKDAVLVLQYASGRVSEFPVSKK